MSFVFKGYAVYGGWVGGRRGGEVMGHEAPATLSENICLRIQYLTWQRRRRVYVRGDLIIN